MFLQHGQAGVMGMLLSEKGIGPTEDRVKAVLEADEPRNAPCRCAQLSGFSQLQ